MKKFLAIFCTVIMLAFALCACSPPVEPVEPIEPAEPVEPIEPIEPIEPPDDGKENVVRFYSIPAGVEQYDGAEVYLGDQQLPLYGVNVNTSQVWKPNGYQRKLNGAGLFELDGAVTVTVKPKAAVSGESLVRPLSANITPVSDPETNTVSFTVKSAGEYAVEINGDKYDAIHLFVSDYGDLPSTEGYANVIVFDAGLHTSANDARIKNDSVDIPSNTLVWLKDGAVVRAKFNSYQKNHVAIVGRGIIDGSTFDRDANKGTVTVPIDFNYCTDVLLSDFFVLDPAGWCVNFYFIDGATIDGIKIITSRSNGDGISLQSCKNIVSDGCFVRTWDDSLVVKNYPRWDNRSQHGSTENIVFKNCTVWTDLAQSMEIGYETVGKVFKDVTFENITVLHALHNAVISIHNANNADVRNIVYRDITVEDGEAPANSALIDVRVLYSSTWSDQHTKTELGSVGGVTVENVKIVSAKKISITVGGCYDDRSGYEGEHYVDGVTVKGIAVGNALPPTSQWRVNKNSYVKNLVLEQAEQVTGARFVFSRTDEYLSAFGKSLKAEFVK